MATAILPTFFSSGLICVGLWFLKNALTASPVLLSMLPFSPNILTHYGLPVVIIGGVIIASIAALSAWTRYTSVRFMFDEFAFHVERGLVSRSEIAIPFRQIQNVNHEQSMTEKMWGMVHVVVETAGTDESKSAQSDGLLPLLDIGTAQALERELLKRSSGK